MPDSTVAAVTHKLMVTLYLLLLIVPVSQASNSQQGEKQETPQEKLENIINKAELVSEKSTRPVVDDPARPEPLPVSPSDPETKKLYEKALQDYYVYRSEGLQHRRAVFVWQLFSAKLIFVIVLILVASGVIFAAIQFRRGIHDGAGSPGSRDDLSTEMEISSKGIKINSPVLGVIILTLSLAFFYLYLVHVYPIENIF